MNQIVKLQVPEICLNAERKSARRAVKACAVKLLESAAEIADQIRFAVEIGDARIDQQITGRNAQNLRAAASIPASIFNANAKPDVSCRWRVINAGLVQCNADDRI